MVMIISLVVLFLLLDLAVLRGWVRDSRESRDWDVPTTFAPSARSAREM